MQVKLSPRLAMIAKYVPEGTVVADIGTDHGYLPVHLMTKNISARVIAGDIHEKPLASARELVQMLNLSNKIEVRLGDGLKILEPQEAEVIIISGMGGGTIVNILESSPEILTTVKRLLLQPMQGSKRLRMWLENNDFQIIEEELVEDDGLIYEIIVAEPGKTDYTPVELFIGPKLLKARPPLLKKFLELKQLHLQNVVQEMDKSNSSKTEIKKKEYNEHIEILHKVIACL